MKKIIHNIEVTTDNRRKKGGQIMMKAFSKIILMIIVGAVGGFLLGTLISLFVGKGAIVSGSSMEPTMYDGQKYRYKAKKTYERNDIVVLDGNQTSYEVDCLLIKRVIGLPGEKIYIDGGKVYINDELLDEVINSEPIEDAGIASEPVILGSDEYFVLGDNRNHSGDSRFFGPVKKAAIEGAIINKAN